MAYWVFNRKYGGKRVPAPEIKCKGAARAFATAFKRRFPEFFQHTEEVQISTVFEPTQHMMVYGSRNLNVSISELQLKQVSHKALTELGADLIVALHGDTPPTTSCLADAKNKHNTGIFKLTRFPVSV